MQVIDISKWNRKNQYENFINYSFPICSLLSKIDVTKLVNRCKTKGESFFSAFLYIVTKSVNEIKDWRVRIKNGNVVIFDKISPSYVVLRDDDSLSTCLTEYVSDYKEFYDNTRKNIENARKQNDMGFGSNAIDCIYVSCLPWVDFSSVTNPYDFKNVEQTSIPRITWGKYYFRDGKYFMALDVAAHHALIDGVHIARLIKKIEDSILNIDEILGE